MIHRALWIAAMLVGLQAQDAPVFLSPLHQSTLGGGGELRIVAKGAGKGRILLDSKPLETLSPVPGVFSAVAKLGPGAHEFVLKNEGSEARAAVFVGAEHADWKAFRQHPPAATCDTCHAVKDGEWATKRASLAPLCGTCHDLAKFPEAHTHNRDTLADCQICHLPHGSQAKGHMKSPKETACKQCHG